MTTRAALLLLTLPLCACASQSYTPVQPHVTSPSGDIFERAGQELATRIPSSAKVAIAPPSLDVRQLFGHEQNQKQAKKELTTRADGYPIRLEGAVAEELGTKASLMTRTHLEPILKEHELQWHLLATDPASRTQLAALTSVDVLITWNISSRSPSREYSRQRGTYAWTYQEEWTLQVLRIETGELLGSVTLRQPATYYQ